MAPVGVVSARVSNDKWQCAFYRGDRGSGKTTLLNRILKESRPPGLRLVAVD